MPSSRKGTLCVAGQVPIDADREVVGADAATQARHVLANLAAVLEAASATLADVASRPAPQIQRRAGPWTAPLR
jgi:enamine deaminase RidA (YjgF/YER057c/UK114 family)